MFPAELGEIWAAGLERPSSPQVQGWLGMTQALVIVGICHIRKTRVHSCAEQTLRRERFLLGKSTEPGHSCPLVPLKEQRKRGRAPRKEWSVIQIRGSGKKGWPREKHGRLPSES